MSTATRKERKRTGAPFVREQKVGTPPLERAANQPRRIARNGTVRGRFGRTAAAIRDLTARGLYVEEKAS